MATREEVLDVLDRALALMNDEGAHWTQRCYSTRNNDDVSAMYCPVGAVAQVTHQNPLRYAQWGYHAETDDVGAEALFALSRAYGGEEAFDVSDAVAKVTGWNDRNDTNWAKVVLRFKRAKKLIMKQGLREERRGY